jgi:hypothetical protein
MIIYSGVDEKAPPLRIAGTGPVTERIQEELTSSTRGVAEQRFPLLYFCNVWATTILWT